jgi:uncharacterized membrane protein YdjX (TVP38/TMEM64 family)
MNYIMPFRLLRGFFLKVKIQKSKVKKATREKLEHAIFNPFAFLILLPFDFIFAFPCFLN